MTCNNINELERFEVLGDLYYKRFGRLRPGKFEAPATGIDSSDELNRREFDNWIRSGQALYDVLDLLIAEREEGRLREK